MYFSFAPNTLFHVWYFQNNSKSFINEVILQKNKTNEAQYAYGYTCILLEKHMAIRLQTISWKFKASFKYNFECWINKNNHNSWKYFMLFFETSQ